MEISSRPKTLILTVGSHPFKQSLLTRYSNQSDFTFINAESKENIFEHALHSHDNIKDKNIIISGVPNNLESYYEAQKKFEDHFVLVLYFKGGADDANENIVIQTYQKLGLLRQIDLDQSKSIEQNYRIFRKNLLCKIIFVGGAPRSGKTKLAKQIASTLGYKYTELDQLVEKMVPNKSNLNEITVVNRLLSSLYCSHEHYVIDGLFKTVQSLTVLTSYSDPLRIFYIQSPNDEIQSEIQLIKDQGEKKQKKKQFEEYLSTTDSVVNFLKNKPYFVRLGISAEENTKYINELKPIVLYVSEFDHQFVDSLAKNWQGTHLNIKQLIDINSKRNKNIITSNSNISDKVAYLKKIISNSNGKIVLSGLSQKLSDFIQFEKNVAEIKLYFKLTSNQQNSKYQETMSPQMHYLNEQKLISLDKNSSAALFLSYLDTRNPYILISGPEASGKTQISKIIARDYGYKHIDYKTYIEQYKEKNPSDNGQELTPAQIIAHFKQLINGNKQTKFIIEGLPFQKQDYLKWVKEVGSPTLINLRVDNDKWLYRSRVVNGGDLLAEPSEQQSQKVASVQAQNVSYMNNINQVLETIPSIKLFQLDCNSPLISLQNFISLIMRPRIYLVAEKNDGSNILYLNIAVKHNFGFFDLAKTDLKTVQHQVTNSSRQRDIILYNYSSKDQLIGQDIHFIQNNIGTIRFVGVWEQQQKQFNDSLMKLERPVVEKKKKVLEEGQQRAEGAEQEAQEEEKQEQLDENGEPIKPKLDIYNFEWSQTGNSKNLSQWFLRSKGSVKQFIYEQSDPKKAYDDFELVVRELNKDRNANAYMIVL